MRILLAGLIGVAAAGSAYAQEPLDIGHPSITKRPQPNMQGPFPEYPPAARRAGQEGKVRVRTCIDASGKPHSGELAESSGNPLLDEASLRWIREHGKFEPAEANGAPVAVCNYEFAYVWSLQSSGSARSATANYLEASTMRPEDLPVVLSRPAHPRYPAGALSRRASGKIAYSICIGADGRLKEVHILDPNADMELASAGTSWFGGSTYRPGMKDGKPVGV